MVNWGAAHEVQEHRGGAQYADSRNLSARIDLHARYSTNPQGWGNWLFAQLDLRPGDRILELGAGPGRLWRDRWQGLPAGCRLVVSDASPGMVREARQALAGAGVGFAAIDAAIREAVARPGGFAIAKDPGLFIAREPR